MPLDCRQPQTRTSRGRLLTAGTILVTTLCGALGARPGAAQQFGRWWWDGHFSLGQRQSDGLIDDRRVRRFGEERARLALGLNGYVLHPAVGDFRLGLELSTAAYEGARLSDSDQVGVELLLNLLQQSGFPTNLFYRRNQYDRVPEAGVDPFTLLGIAESTDRWGGRVRLRKGPLKGTLLGAERNSMRFLSELADEEVREREFLDWSRTGERLNHHLRLERRYQDYGNVDLATEDTTANFDQSGNLTPRLRWELSGIAVVRDLTIDRDTVGSEDYRLRSRLLRQRGERNQLELRYDGALFQTDLADDRESQAVSTLYRWRPRERWEVSPFAAFSLVSIDGVDLESPRAGLSVAWRRSEKRLTTGFGGRISFGSVERRAGTEVRRDSQAAYSFSASLRHGLANGFRQELEAEASRNEIRFGRDPVLDLPDVALPPGGLTTEDRARLRGTLGWRWDSRYLNVAAEWFRRDSTRQSGVDELSADMIRLALQAGSSTLGLQLDTGETTNVEGRLGEQRIRYTSAVASWRPLRFLRLQALHRLDRRELILAPDIDSERTELGLTWRVGAVEIEGRAFERAQQLVGAAETVNRGFHWSVSRRFSGWLPIVTGAGRRGVIR